MPDHPVPIDVAGLSAKNRRPEVVEIWASILFGMRGFIELLSQLLHELCSSFDRVRPGALPVASEPESACDEYAIFWQIFPGNIVH